jgi:ATP-dependent DNA helicase RecG
MDKNTIDAPTNPLQESAQFLRGVGPARFELLRRLGVETVGDLLWLFPRAYEDLSDCRTIAQLTANEMQTVVGEVVELDGKVTKTGKEMLSVVIKDETGVLEGVWFNQTFMAKRFRYGQRVAYSGKPQQYMGHWQMNNPRVKTLDAPSADGEEQGIVPVYQLTEGLHAEQMRRIQKNVAENYPQCVAETLPQVLRAKQRLPGIAEALHDMHLPASLDVAKNARRRLVYEEFLVLQLGLALRRRDLGRQEKAAPLQVTEKIDERIRRLFPFKLTRDQNRAIVEICRDMANDRPMQRLLQADVGAGKTAVAVYALLLAVAYKCQAAIMAPTEVLARQHWRTLSNYLAQSRVRKQLLTGGLTSKERKVALGEIRMGNVDLVIGTQAIIQDDVEFQRLGLVVIDEQHRFGVAQRARIRKMGESPHYLVLTATPIPRTIALTVFGDLDVSVIREQPPGRKPVTTRSVSEAQRLKLYSHLREEMKKGRQLYVVCPLVEESEARDTKAAEQTYEELRQAAFKDFSIGLLHGRLDDKLKDQVMTRFRDGETQMLVSTTVIEVGVDVPNATLMVIEHADRFGLSQLHQLRGRISRGPVGGECYIFADAANEETKERLKLFTRIRDGFALAEEDVKIRGMGEFFGTKQHGLGELRLGNLVRDADILSIARHDAFAMVADDPGLRKSEHAALRRLVLERYGKTLDLVEIG